MAKNLHLYTMTFPYGRGEAFLEAEVGVLSENFDHIMVYPLQSNGEQRALPANFTVVNVFENQSIKVSKKLQLSFLSKAKKNFQFLKDFRYQWSYAGGMVKKCQLMAEYFKKASSEGIHYSYWFEEWTLVLSMLTTEGIIQDYITRAHGFDLYEERARLGYQPWRDWQLSKASGVYSVSKSGADYLMKKYPHHSNKIKTSYLGSIDFGMGNQEKTKELQLVSCSNIIPLKRVDRIAKALGLMDEHIHWTHIGDGKELHKVKTAMDALPENISVTLTGSMPHDAVMDFYKKSAIDCFVNVSTTEGIPVSMMEALSFGIPILATDVGGVHEIVAETGALISSDFTDEELADALKQMFASVRSDAPLDSDNKQRLFWKNNFSALGNYQAFCKRITQGYAV